MPIYLSPKHQQRFEAPDSMSQEEVRKHLETLDRFVEAQEAPSVMNDRTAPSMGAYVKDRIKGQIAKTGGQLVGGLNALLGGEGGYEDPATRTQAEMGTWLGYEGLQADSKPMEWAGTALTEPFSPINYAIPGGPLAKRGMQAILPSFAADAASAAVDADPGSVGDIAARAIGGGAAGMTQGFRQAATRKGLEAARTGVMNRLGRGANQEIEARLDASVKGQLQDVFRAAVATDPDVLRTMQQMMQQAEQMGVDLPLHALADNAVFDAAIRGLASRHPGFRQQYWAQYQNAKEQIRQTQESLFGDPRTAVTTLSEKTMPGAPEADLQRAQMKSIDRQARKLSEPYARVETDPDVARRFTKLVDDKIKADSPVGSRLFEQTRKQAEESGAALSSQSSEALYNMVKSEGLDNPFTGVPTVMNKLREYTKPDKGGFRGMDYAQVRDLQEEIGSLMRQRGLSGADAHVLGQLQKQLDGMIATDFPKEVAGTLQAARTRYAYDMTMKDFSLTAMDRKTGILDMNKAVKWAEENRKSFENLVVVDELGNPVPGLSLREAMGDAKKVAALLAQRARIENVPGKMRVEAWAEEVGLAPSDLMGRMYKDPAFANQAILKFRGDSDAIKAMRAYALQDALDAGEGAVKWLNDKDRAVTLQRLFGAGYVKQVDRLAEISGKLAKSPAEIGINFEHGVTKGWFERNLGVPLSMIFSKLRNPILSGPQAVLELLSRSGTTLTAKKFDENLTRLLASPKDMVGFLRELDSAVAQKDYTAARKALERAGLDVFGETVRGTGRGFAVGATSPIDTDQPPYPGQGMFQ